MIREADVNHPNQVNLLDPDNQLGVLEPEMVNVPDNKEDYITGVENDENL